MQASPYISDRKKKRRQRRKYLFGVLAVLALYIFLYAVQWFLFHSPIFRMDKVVVQGNSSVASADIITLTQAGALPSHSFFPAVFGFNNMLLWPGHIASSELEMIPQLASVSIAKDYFTHTVTISVTERIPFGVWCFSSNSNCYWYDNTGTIFERSLDTQGNLVYMVNDHAQAARGLNQKVLSNEFVANFISIVKTLRTSGLGVKEIDLNDLALEEMDVVTTNGPALYFSLRFPADEYLGYIQKLMLDPGFGKLQYIDCRTQNRLYYK